jgi:hypothetical protein
VRAVIPSAGPRVPTEEGPARLQIEIVTGQGTERNNASHSGLVCGSTLCGVSGVRVARPAGEERHAGQRLVQESAPLDRLAVVVAEGVVIREVVMLRRYLSIQEAVVFIIYMYPPPHCEQLFGKFEHVLQVAVQVFGVLVNADVEHVGHSHVRVRVEHQSLHVLKDVSGDGLELTRQWGLCRSEKLIYIYVCALLNQTW